MTLIRKANKTEVNKLNDLAFCSKAYWGYSAKFMRACKGELSVIPSKIDNYDFAIFVAELKNQIIGFYELECLPDKQYELNALFVDPNHIRQGIGKQLIDHAKITAKNAGAVSIIIQGDPNATEFYQSVGGTLIGQRESESIPGRFLPTFFIDLSENK